MHYPCKREAELLVRELADETLVYDLATNKSHCLNQQASFVWQLCDGKTSLADLAAKVQSELGIDEASTVVELALEQLSSRDLLTHTIPPVSAEAREARRDVLKKLAAALVGLPLVTTMTAPAAHAQASPTSAPTTVVPTPPPTTAPR